MERTGDEQPTWVGNRPLSYFMNFTVAKPTWTLSFERVNFHRNRNFDSVALQQLIFICLSFALKEARKKSPALVYTSEEAY